MKRIIIISSAIVAVLSALVACQKNNDTPAETPGNPEKKQVTITASIPEGGLTKVTLTPQDGTPKTIKLEWENNDIITINGEEFVIDPTSISLDGQSASFSGTEPTPDAGKYTIAYNKAPKGGFATQAQAADGDYDHLGYGVTLGNVTDYSNVTFSESWATSNSATFAQSSVLWLRALLPDAVATSVKKVIFKASQNVFNGTNTFSVTLGDAGVKSGDNKLDVYATIPSGAVTSGAMDLLVQFQVHVSNEYDKYTAYRVIPNGTDFGTTQYLGLNCSNIESFANASDTSIGESTNPYLIGDKHQLYYMRTALDTDDVTKYFKLVDNVDWTGGVPGHSSWTNLNNVKNGSDTWTRAVNLDGNDKTISNLNDSMFYVLMGEVRNLSLYHSTITIAGFVCGALAAYINQPNTVVYNVDVINSSIENNGTCEAGGLIGLINNVDAALAATITNCDVTDTDVHGGPVGGLIGYANSQVNVSGCTYSDGTVSTGDKPYAGGLVGRCENFASTFTDCHVTDAVIDASSLTTAQTHFGRIGGFTGMLSTQGQIKGCSVGEDGSPIKVIVPAADNVNNKKNLNSGGFAGINYGLITKNGDTRTKAYVDIVTTNAADTELHLGGFVGYNTGTIEYADAVVSFSSSSSSKVNLTTGQQIGGFVGYNFNETASQLGKIEHCTVSGAVSGGQYLGGFAGYLLKKNDLVGDTHASLTDCHASVTVTGAGHYSGGLVGYIADGTLTDCDASGNVTSTGKNRAGGLVGQGQKATITHCYATGDVSALGYSAGLVGTIANDPKDIFTISKCYATGNVTLTSAQGGALVGTHLGLADQASAGALNINNCYAAGNVSASQRAGGLMANHYSGTTTIENCYSSGSITADLNVAGIVAWVERDGLSLTRCMPWNSEIRATNTDAKPHYSSGCVIGYANKGNSPKVIVAACYRKSTLASNFNDCSSNSANVVEQHSPITTAAAIPQRKSLSYGYYHHGRNTNYGLTELVNYATVHSASSVIGGDWDPDIWDLTGDNADYPTLR